MIDPQDEAHQAEADAIGDAQPPDWLGVSEVESGFTASYPAASDEFDVRLHRHELGLLTDLLRALSGGHLGKISPDTAEAYRGRAATLQDMLDNPFGGWVERTGPEAEVLRLIKVLGETLNLEFGQPTLKTFLVQLERYGFSVPALEDEI